MAPIPASLNGYPVKIRMQSSWHIEMTESTREKHQIPVLIEKKNLPHEFFPPLRIEQLLYIPKNDWTAVQVQYFLHIVIKLKKKYELNTVEDYFQMKW